MHYEIRINEQKNGLSQHGYKIYKLMFRNLKTWSSIPYKISIIMLSNFV